MYFTVIILLYMIMILGILLNCHHLIQIILFMEGVGIAIILAIFTNYGMMANLFTLISVMIMIVCEGCFSLSLLVSLTRSSGEDKVYANNLWY